MNLIDISNLRLANQQISESKFRTVKDIVGWMGAIQAQDYIMSKWAIGIRLPGSTESLIESSVNNGEIIRTHLMRPTWHFVSSDDIYWMLDLTAPQILSSLKFRDKELELTKDIYNRSNYVIENSLRDGNHLSRAMLMAEIVNSGIRVDENRGSHLLMKAELDGIICSGKIIATKPSYALLSERVPLRRKLTRDEQLAELARRYFTSHSPATLQDFTWWSGLSSAEARQALEIVKPGLTSETIHNKVYWMTISDSAASPNNSIYFLPAYDEFIISYKDRTPSMSVENHRKTISINGFFRPVVVINGQIRGIWKRTIKKEKVTLETEFFDYQEILSNGRMMKAADDFGSFVKKQIEIPDNQDTRLVKSAI